MAESNDVEALEQISSQVDESQFKIILTNQCIKAQEFLVHKLRKQSEQTKQICNFISNGNLKLESEIRLGEQEIKSLRSALDTIKYTNVELEKDFLLAKENKTDLVETVSNGIKKYEELWLTSKKKYDNIPFIKKQLLIVNNKKNLEDDIASLDTELEKLRKAVEERKDELANTDKQHVVHIARYVVNERPEVLRRLKEKSEEVNYLKREIEGLRNEKNLNTPKVNYPIAVDNKVMNEILYEVENKYIDRVKDSDPMLLPKLQIQNNDLDILTEKLEQVKKADNTLNKKVDSITIQIDKNLPKKINQENMNDIYVSSYFKNINDIKEDDKNEKSQTINYKERKLIHILDDIRLPKMDTYNIFSKLNPNEFQDVNVIKASEESTETNQIIQKADTTEPVDDDKMEVIEEIDLTVKDTSNVLVPPTQFLDYPQNSQEKKVMFSTVVQEVDTNINKSQEYVVEEMINSELNTSGGSDNSYQKIKDDIFKKRNLALSPEFAYSRNPVKNVSDHLKSKFFDERNNKEKQTEAIDVSSQNKINKVDAADSNNEVPRNIPEQQSVTGFLFTHGPKGIPDSLDVSMTSSCVEDVDNEYPHCFDSSLLLSPKADSTLPGDGNNNAVVLSQEVPNFLSGFKKAGFSFFGNSSTENNKDSDKKNPNNNFNFSFSNTEKKNRGGFFNMFH